MIESKRTTNFYFHPILIPALLLFPLVLALPIASLFKVVTSFKGYVFIFFMITVTLLLTIRIIKYFILLISRRPALTLTEVYLIDYQSGFSIDWKDIMELQFFGGYQTSYISIKLIDSEKYVSLFKNPVAKCIYRLNSKHFHGSFHLNVSLIKCNNEKLLETLELYLKTAKNK